jgi:hypothetical protein
MSKEPGASQRSNISKDAMTGKNMRTLSGDEEDNDASGTSVPFPPLEKPMMRIQTEADTIMAHSASVSIGFDPNNPNGHPGPIPPIPPLPWPGPRIDITAKSVVDPVTGLGSLNVTIGISQHPEVNSISPQSGSSEKLTESNGTRSPQQE